MGDTAFNLDLIHPLNAHTEIFLEHLGINIGSGDTHGRSADTGTGLAFHRTGSNGSLSPKKKLVTDILRNADIGGILNIMTVNSKSREFTLGVGGHNAVSYT